jgi:CRISPR-associated protein Csm1
MEKFSSIALAALLHNIGKFADKSKNELRENQRFKTALKKLNLNIDDIFSENEIIKLASKIVNNYEKKENNKKRLKSLFDKNREYKIDKLSPENIFPTKENDNKNLWNEFLDDLEKAEDKQAVDYLYKKYTTFISSPYKSDIPLYDYSKVVSLFAVTIKTLLQSGVNIKEIENKNKNNFLLISGDFFGIQNFIFDEVQTKFAAKILRARSAFIQILVKVLAFYICEKLEISKYSIISTHAGKFEILAPNKAEIIEKLKKIQNEFNEFFIENFFGETGVGITWIEASMEDFLLKNKYKNLRKNLADKVEEIKYKKFSLNKKGYVIFEIEDLDNENLCDFCHKRKGEKKEEYTICPVGENYVKIGKALVNNKFLAISKKRKNENDIKIFEGYYLHFFDNPSKKEAKEDIAIYDITTDTEFRGFEKWELSSYVKTKKDNENKEILTLEELAKESVKEGKINEKRYFGVEAIMALKGDADGMGNFIKSSDVTDNFAKYNFFARMIDYYFSVYVPIKFMQNRPFYTVFAGGDDLFVLGAWNEIIDLAKNVRDDFVKFTNNKLTFSTGLIMAKANKPVNFLAYMAENALEEAKDFCCEIEKNRCKEICNEKEKICSDENKNIRKKDAVNIFNQTVRWKSFKRIRNCTLNKFLEYEEKYKKELPTTFLYRLIELSEMSIKVMCKGDIKSTIWKSKLNYLYTRNISDKEFELLKFLNKVIEKYPKEFIANLFEFIYERRKNA